MTERPAPPLPRFIARELPYERRLVSALGRDVHAIDDGPRDGRVVALFHGNPMWSFLWRKVLAALRAQPGGERLRIVAPDLLGLGLSHKPRWPTDHTVSLHVEAMTAALEALDARPSIVVGQDWGGPIGAGVAQRLEGAGRAPGALMFMNTAVLPPKRPIRATSFHRFAQRRGLADAAFYAALFPVPVLNSVQGEKTFDARTLAAYAWPLRFPWDRAAPLGLARMVPHREGHESLPVLDAIGAWAERWSGPIGLLWGERDPILGRALARHREAFPHALVETTSAGHFLQEQVPDRIAAMIVRLLEQVK